MTLNLNRITGVLEGVALGDAMGMPTEVRSQTNIWRMHPNGIRKLLPSEGGSPYSRDLPAGSVTDDTINTILLAKMLIKNHGQVDVNYFVHELENWLDDSSLAQYVAGPSTTNAIKKIEKGIPIEQAGITGTTNGAAMKIAPIGIAYDYRQPEKLVQAVYQICLPTHNTHIAIAGACAVAATVSYVVRGGEDLTEIWQIACDFISQGEKLGFDFPSADLKIKLKKAREIVNQVQTKKELLQRLYAEIGSGMEMIETIPCVFSIIAFTHGDPWQTVQLTSIIGWDTDTIGAIAGGICGGMHPELLPQKMIEQIKYVNEIDFLAIAEQLHEALKNSF